MASRVCNEIATKYDPKNHVLNYCMSSNISGVIGSAVAALSDAGMIETYGGQFLEGAADACEKLLK